MADGKPAPLQRGPHLSTGNGPLLSSLRTEFPSKCGESSYGITSRNVSPSSISSRLRTFSSNSALTETPNFLRQVDRLPKLGVKLSPWGAVSVLEEPNNLEEQEAILRAVQPPPARVCAREGLAGKPSAEQIHTRWEASQRADVVVDA